MEQKNTSSEKIIARLKNNRIFASLIVFGTIVIALSTFTDATKKLVALVGRHRPEDARIELTRMSLPYTAAAFVHAARKGDVVAVKLFLAAGMPVDEMPEREWTTALIEAARENQPEMVNILLKANADAGKRVPERGTALEAAAASGHKSIVEVLLKKSPTADVLKGAFVDAAHSGHHEILRMVLDRGGNLDQVKSPALISAAGSRRGTEKEMADTVSLLLDVGADVNIKDGEKSWPALHYAAYKGYPAVLQTLLNRGAPPNTGDRDGRTALWWASGVGLYVQAVVLLAKGADANAKDNEGTTALQRAKDNQDTKMVRLLLDHGAN